jgi:ATP-dependent helicase/nuclease subunit A
MLAGKGDDGVFVDHVPIDEQMSDAERQRLLYVACTRAVDHLVVSLHRPPAAKNNPDGADRSKLTSAELLWYSGAAEPPSGARLGDFRRQPIKSHDPLPLELDWRDRSTWAAERRRVLTTASRRSGIAATRLAAELSPHVPTSSAKDDVGLDKQPVNIEQPPWQRGRYGTSIGRAVHGVLQFCDLADGHDIATLARAQCAAEGVIGLDEQVAALARSAIAAPIVRSVVGGLEHWRELFVAAMVGDRVLEGYVDLLVRTPDGLVIVDYKTDQWSGPVQTGERLGKYRLQLAAYAAALESALGESIAGGVLIRCVADGPAEQIDIGGWNDAIDEVRRLVKAPDDGAAPARHGGRAPG